MDRLIAIDVVRFPEHHVKNHQTETCNKYDITATDFDISPDFLVRGQFSLPHYCHALLRKTFTLCNNQLSEFLQYQVRMVQKPWKWLEYLEILIRNNSPLLSEMGLEHKTQYVLDHVESRQRAITRERVSGIEAYVRDSMDVEFDILCVRQRLQQVKSYEEKLHYLMRLKVDYQLHKPAFICETSMPYDRLIDLEIETLNLQRRQNSDHELYFLLNNDGGQKCPTNLTVAQLANLLRILNDDKILQIGNKTAFVKMIANNFLAKDGKPISWKSLKNHFEQPVARVQGFWRERFFRLYRRLGLE